MYRNHVIQIVKIKSKLNPVGPEYTIMNNKKHLTKSSKINKPIKIQVIKPSKYEAHQALQANKKYWKDVFYQLDHSNDETEENFTERNRLDQVLPHDLCEQVCSILKLPLHKTKSQKEVIKESEYEPRRIIKQPHISFRTRLYIDREMDTDTDVEVSPRDKDVSKPNVYWEFLNRPEREMATWPTRYIQPETDEEKTLEKRADDLTDKIAREFCSYMQDLGGKQKSQLFTPEAIKDLFQVDFDKEIARGLKIIMKELPTVPENIAIVTENPDRSQYAALEREISKDIKKERRPDVTRAFNTSLSLKDRYIAPKNNTAELWRSAKYVPKDLVTLKTVWEGITNIKSVKEYCRWMIDHPEHPRAPYLNSLGMFDEAVLKSRISNPDMDLEPTASPMFIDLHKDSIEVKKLSIELNEIAHGD